MTLKKQNQGFTIVELLIVIVVIGILAAIVLTTFRGVQETARDQTRETDIQSIHKQIEAYYAENTTYPTLDKLNELEDGGFVDTELAGLAIGALYAPGVDVPTAPAATDNPMVATASAALNAYGYEASSSTSVDGSCDGDVTSVPCDEYTLTAPLENGDTYTQSEL